MPHFAASNLGLHCLPFTLLWIFRLKRLESTIHNIVFSTKIKPKNKNNNKIKFKKKKKSIKVGGWVANNIDTDQMLIGLHSLRRPVCPNILVNYWVAPCENVSLSICEHQRTRSAWASTLSDQGLCCQLTESLDTIEFISGEQMPVWDCAVWNESESAFRACSKTHFRLAQPIQCWWDRNFVSFR